MRKSNLTIPIAVVVVGFAIVIPITVAWWFFGQNVELITGGSHATITESEIRQNAVSLAVGDILWIETPRGGRGAIRFDRMTNDWGADYTSWYLPPGSPDSLSSVTASRGHVLERYWRTRTKANSSEVDDIGGDYTVECGPLSIEWSASTWLYIPAGYQFAISKSPSAGIDVDRPSLDWYTSAGQ